MHYLRNLAEPLAAADAAFKGELRQTVRAQVGDLLRQEPQRLPGQAGVLTVTGLLPSPVEAAYDTALPKPPACCLTPASRPAAEAVLTQLIGHTRYLLTLKGRPPFRLAGLETYERLQQRRRFEPRLAGYAL